MTLFFDILHSPLSGCRRSSPSPILYSRSLLPFMDPQRLEKALDGCGNDLDAAIERLLALSLDDESEGFGAELDASSEKENPTSFEDLAGWTDLLVRELQSTISVDDARARVSSLLQMREETIHQQEAARIEVFSRENTILKRAVAVLYRRQNQFVEDRNEEVQLLKQLLSHYQEQLRTLEVSNYGLMMHLRRDRKTAPLMVVSILMSSDKEIKIRFFLH